MNDGARIAKAKDHIAAREALRSLNDGAGGQTMSDIGNLNSAFHLALIVPHQQPVTCEVLSRLHTLSQRYVRMHLLPVGRVRRATREHNALYEAWARGMRARRASSPCNTSKKPATSWPNSWPTGMGPRPIEPRPREAGR